MPLLLIIGFMVAFVSGIVNAQYAAYGGLGTMHSIQVEQRYVNAVGRAMNKWYAEHLLDMDMHSTPVFPGCPSNKTSCVLKQIGVVPKYGVRIQFGSLNYSSSGPLIAWRNIDIWVPKSNVSGVTLRNQFIESNAFVYNIVSGGPIERAALNRTEKTEEFISNLFQRGYSAELAQYGDAEIDWFQNPKCPSSGFYAINDNLNCSSSASGWVPLAQSGIEKFLDYPIHDSKTNPSGVLANPWGEPYMLCNNSVCGSGNSVENSSVPYTALIRSVTPWSANGSGDIDIYVVEPLNTAS